MELWTFFLNLVGVCWTMPSSVPALLYSWGNIHVKQEIKQVWKLVPLSVPWCLWRERNARIFEGEEATVAQMSGLGGCPYAKGAFGNVATEDVVYMLNGLGVRTNVDHGKLMLAGDFISKHLVQKQCPSSSKTAVALSKVIALDHGLDLLLIIGFLSKATLIGFMAGAAIIVSLQQLKSLLGITHFTKQMGLVPGLSSVFHNTKEVVPMAISRKGQLIPQVLVQKQRLPPEDTTWEDVSELQQQFPALNFEDEVCLEAAESQDELAREVEDELADEVAVTTRQQQHVIRSGRIKRKPVALEEFVTEFVK